MLLILKDIFSSDNSNMLSSLSHSSLSAIGDKNPRVIAGRGKLPLRVDLKNKYLHLVLKLEFQFLYILTSELMMS